MPPLPCEHGKSFKVKICTGCFQGASEKRCLGQDEGVETWQWERPGERKEEVPLKAPPPQAQERDGDAQTDGILQAPLPQIRHFDCDILYLYPSNRYKALIYCNRVLVQEMYDLSVLELRQRLRHRLVELDATYSSPLTPPLQWAFKPSALDDPSAAFWVEVIETKNPCF